MRIFWWSLLCLALASQASAQEAPRLYKFSFATAVVAHSADLSTTEFCLGAHRCKEANPFLAPFSDRPLVFGAVKMGGAALQLWAISRIQNKRVATIANVVVTGVFTGIALRNARLTPRR